MRKKKKVFTETRKWYRYQFFGTATITVLQEKIIAEATVANTSFSGIGLYSPTPVGKSKKVKIKVSFIDRNGKVCEAITTGKVDWQSKFINTYLIGVIFDEELNMVNQPLLLEHLIWLINTYNWPQPYQDKRITTV